MPPEPVLPSRLLGALPGLAGTAPVSLAWLAASMGPAAPGLLLVLLAILSMIPTGLPVAVPFGLCIALIGAVSWLGTLVAERRTGVLAGLLTALSPLVLQYAQEVRAYVFVMLGVVREKIALGIILMDVILYSVGGVIGTMHHLYFSGTPV